MSVQQLRLERRYREQMESHVASTFPEEACGLLAGVGEKVMAVIPVNNALRSPFQFRMDPHDQLSEFLNIEKNGWELLGIYHSHPQGDAYPSETDLAEAYYPEIAYLIWARNQEQWFCQAFHLKNLMVIPINLIDEL